MPPARLFCFQCSNIKKMPLKQGTEISCRSRCPSYRYKKDAPKAGDGNSFSLFTVASINTLYKKDAPKAGDGNLYTAGKPYARLNA